MGWTFDTGDQAWTGGEWSESNGSPAPGCLYDTIDELFNPPVVQSPASVSCAAGDPFSCRIRIVATSASGGTVDIYMSLGPVLGPRYGFVTEELTVAAGVPYDSGWMILSGAATDTGSNFAIVIGTSLGTIDTCEMYVDTVSIDEVWPPMETFEYIHSSGGIPGSVMI